MGEVLRLHAVPVILLEGESLADFSYIYGFSYCFTLALRAEHRILLFCISVAEHCLFASPSFFTSALVCGPVEYLHVYEGSTSFAESFVSLLFPADVQSFVPDVVLSSVF